jgi:hypothetical protein
VVSTKKRKRLCEKATKALIFVLLLIPCACAEIQFAQEDPGLYVTPEYPILPTDRPGGDGTEVVLAEIAQLPKMAEASNNPWLEELQWILGIEYFLDEYGMNLTNQTF